MKQFKLHKEVNLKKVILIKQNTPKFKNHHTVNPANAEKLKMGIKKNLKSARQFAKFYTNGILNSNTKWVR